MLRYSEASGWHERSARCFGVPQHDNDEYPVKSVPPHVKQPKFIPPRSQHVINFFLILTIVPPMPSPAEWQRQDSAGEGSGGTV